MKKVLACLSLALGILTMTAIVAKNEIPPTNGVAYHLPLQQETLHPLDNMPVVPDHPCASYGSNVAPIEQRDASVRRYLAPSLKIQCSNCSGSGTIVYYDSRDGWAYVQSCGHLWNGSMNADEGKRRNITCKVITWYHNDNKLPETKSYEAFVLYYSNTRGQDCSLLRFKPDWVPQYFPIAPADYPLTPGTRLHSVGCDGGREVAHYDVEVVGLRNASETAIRGRPQQVFVQGEDLITKNNSPRPGRSGGGLMTTDGFYVGICWGTSDTSGNGIGLFTPLVTVRSMNDRNGFGWLNEVHQSLARKIPIMDHNNPQGTYPKDYIPLPNGR